MQAQRDQNNITTMLLDKGGETVSLPLDYITGAVITTSTYGTPNLVHTQWRCDDNNVRVMMGVNRITGEPMPVHLDTDGKILVHLV